MTLTLSVAVLAASVTAGADAQPYRVAQVRGVDLAAAWMVVDQEDARPAPATHEGGRSRERGAWLDAI